MRRQSGFTLMEALVVLMLVSILVSLAFEMLGAYRIAKGRVFESSADTDRRALVQTWFADSVRGMVALPDAMPTGTSTKLAGVTLSPAMSAQGGPVPVEWELLGGDGRSTLIYREYGEEMWRYSSWAEDTEPRFVYAGDDGEASDRWPPALGEQTRLPSLVVLTSGGEGVSALAAAPRSGKPVRAEVFELETD